MPGNTFIRFLTSDTATTIKGESLQEDYLGKDGWIDVDEWSWDVSADTSFLKGGGSAVGKPNPEPLSITVAYSVASPPILDKIVKGTVFPFAVMDMLKQVGDESKGKPQLFFRKVMKDVFITKVAIKGGEDGAVSQDIEMVFKQVAVGYKRQLNSGKLDSGPIVFNWNVSAMTGDSDLGQMLSNKF